MATLNAEWHRAHVMPKNATERQRAKWHYEHAQKCGCRAVTPSIAVLLKEHGYPAPKLARKAGAAGKRR
jgi:hypothetical protein